MSDKTQVDWRKSTINYLKKNFNLKNNLLRLYVFLGVCAVFLPIAISVNVWAQNAPQTQYGSNGFINIYITTNDGISFSMMQDCPRWSIYMVQWLTSIVILGIVCFCKKWYYILFWSCAFIGGVFNVIDRACPKVVDSIGNHVQYNVVMDYLKFAFLDNWGIFNIPDIFVCVGVIAAVVAYIVENMISLFKNDKKSK